MKTIASMLFSIFTVIGAGFLFVSVASHLSPDYKPHRFSDLSKPALWTSGPVQVDVATQINDRLPPAYSSYAVETPQPASAKPAVQVADKVIEPAPQSEATEQHVAWCESKYRSFDPATNQYRAYDGQLRPCSSPAQPVATTQDVASAEPLAGDVVWCTARYKSYRASDNTYQPFDGGPRRACLQSNDVADARASP